MKKNKILCILIFLFFIFGCVNKNETNEIDKNIFQDDQSQTLAQFTFGLVNSKIEYEYNGKPLYFNYFIQNSNSAALEVGLFVAIDGILQEYTINEKTLLMHCIQIEKNQENRFTIKLEPQIGLKDQDYNLNFFIALNPKSSVNDLKLYTNQHSINQNTPLKLHFNTNIGTIEKECNYDIQQISSQEKDKYRLDVESNFKYQYETNNIICIEQDSQEVLNFLDINKKVEVNIFGKEGNYEIIQFVNMIPKQLGMIKLENNCKTVITTNIPEDTVNYFILLIPKKAGEMNFVTQSDRYIIQK